jgi:PKD repeat protein
MALLGMRRRAAGILLSVGIGVVAPGCEELPEIPNVPPTASFVYTPVSPIFAGGTLVTFNASASRDADGSIAKYSWDFGDGSPVEETTEPTIARVYPNTPAECQENVYTVLLVVTDDDGDTASANQRLTVVELPLMNSRECRDRLE